MTRRWDQSNTTDSQTAEQLSAALGISPLVAALLVQRDICSPEAARAFFYPKHSELYDPFLFSGMEEAVQRILLARERDERVAIYGDSDVDGITAMTVLLRMMSNNGWNVEPYIPVRSDTSYGLHEPGIDELKAKGISLLITVDMGTTAVQASQYAKSVGVDIIITDHHEPAAVLPVAVAILNPKLKDSSYPYRELSGCGVAFKLVHALAMRIGIGWDEITHLLELVALGTTADIVPLIDENRVMLTIGLQSMKTSALPGLLALCEVAGIDLEKVCVDDLLMTLSPRLNAAARMGNPYRALHLLVCDDHDESNRLAVAIEQDNQKRRTVDDAMMRDAIATIQQQYDPACDSAIVIAKSGWHLGVIGILASRIAEMYHRPTVVLAIENGIGRGSARTVNRLDIHAALRACSDGMLQFGGHRCAAGLTIPEDLIPEFARRFKEYVSNAASKEELAPCLRIDAELSLNEINSDLFNELQMLAPFGPGNPKPQFVARHVERVGAPKPVGSKHVRFKLRQHNRVFSAIALGMSHRLNELSNGNPYYDVCFAVEHNNNGWDHPLQLRVLDFRTVNSH